MKLIELFAGIGTQYQALSEYTNVEVVAISEIDKRPLSIYTSLHETPNNLGDITKIQKLPYADIWTYSFPCTDLSIAGKQEGFSGKNSSLIYEVYRLLLSSEKPKILIMENVSNIINNTFMPQFKDWMNTLKILGYNSAWEKIKACDYGGGTVRERVFMISTNFSLPTFIFPKKIGTQKTVIDYLETPNDQYFIDICNLTDITEKNYKKAVKLADYKKGGQGNRIYSTLGQGVTLTANGGGKAGSSGGLYLRDNKIYKLSPKEMCKIMGWPEKQANIICENATPREVGFCLGNAIDLNVMKIIMQAIVTQYLTLF